MYHDFKMHATEKIHKAPPQTLNKWDIHVNKTGLSDDFETFYLIVGQKCRHLAESKVEQMVILS